MSLEERVEVLERRLNRYRLILVGMALAWGGIVLSGATPEEEGVVEAEIVAAKAIFARNADGQLVAGLGVDDAGNGLLQLYSQEGKNLLVARIDTNGNGQLRVYSREEKDLFLAGGDEGGDGLISVFSRTGQEEARLVAAEKGGWLNIWNQSGDDVVQIYADEYGQGYIGVWDSRGQGRSLTPR